MLKYCFIILFFFLGTPKHPHQIVVDSYIDIEIFQLERRIERMNIEAWMLITEIKKEQYDQKN